MKKLCVLFCSAVLVSAAFMSCTTISPGYGIGSNAIVSDASMEKTGEASGAFLFGFIPLTNADISLSSAAANGGITKIATVDTRSHSILGIVVTRTTIVTGE